jgi:tetratricopeptide (TPR) repeat protein
MSNLAPDLSELHAALSLAQPALFSLRYRSALVLDDILRTMRQLIAPRLLHELRYQVETDRVEAAAFQLVSSANHLAADEIPVIALRPEPGADPKSPALAAFWKVVNGQRETLGHLNAIVLICLDDAHTGAAYHHARDLISWCAPKFEFDSLTPISGDRPALIHSESISRTSGSGGRATWYSLHPLWRQALASGKPLTADLTTRIVLPLLRAAVANGMVSEGHAFMQEANAAHVPFRDERQRSLWLETCGDLAVAQGDLAWALRSYTESKTLRERLAASDPANAAWQRDLSVSLERLGDLAVAQGDLAGALRSFTDAKTIRERLAVSDPANTKWQRDLSVSLEKLGDLAVAKGDLAGALRYYTDAKTIRERLAASDPANTKWQRDLSVSLEKHGDLAVAKGDLAGALRYYTEGKAIAERLVASDYTNAEWQRDFWMSNGKLGDLATAQGDLPAALDYWTKANEVTSRLAANDPANAAWQRDLSVSLNKLGDLAVAQGDLNGALRSFTEGKNIAERLAASDSANAAWQRDLSYSCYVIAAEVFQPQQRWAEALALMEQSLLIDERLAATDPTNVVWQKDVKVSRALVEKLRAKVAGESSGA